MRLAVLCSIIASLFAAPAFATDTEQFTPPRLQIMRIGPLTEAETHDRKTALVQMSACVGTSYATRSTLGTAQCAGTYMASRSDTRVYNAKVACSESVLSMPVEHRIGGYARCMQITLEPTYAVTLVDPAMAAELDEAERILESKQ